MVAARGWALKVGVGGSVVCWSVVCGLGAYLGAMLTHLGGYVTPA